MGCREFVLYNNTNRAVVSEVVNIPFGIVGVRDVALVGEDEDGVTLRGLC